MKTADGAYLAHILEAIADIESYASVGEAAFAHDRMRQDGILRKLEIIGEAAKHLSPELTAHAPEIIWHAITGLRNRLIHGYWSVDIELVWKVITTDLPRLRSAVERLAALVDPAPPHEP